MLYSLFTHEEMCKALERYPQVSKSLVCERNYSDLSLLAGNLLVVLGEEDPRLLTESSLKDSCKEIREFLLSLGVINQEKDEIKIIKAHKKSLEYLPIVSSNFRDWIKELETE